MLVWLRISFRSPTPFRTGRSCCPRLQSTSEGSATSPKDRLPSSPNNQPKTSTSPRSPPLPSCPTPSPPLKSNTFYLLSQRKQYKTTNNFKNMDSNVGLNASRSGNEFFRPVQQDLERMGMGDTGYRIPRAPLGLADTMVQMVRPRDQFPF